MEQTTKQNRLISAASEFKEIAEQRFIARCNEASALNNARWEGYAEGLTQVYITKIMEVNGVPEAIIQKYVNGYEEGYAEGKADGELKGKVEERTRIVKNMYQKGFSIETIAKALCLSEGGVKVFIKSNVE